MVRMLFSDQDSLHWLKAYNGFFNGKHPVRFTLASNGTAIRGVSHYLQSSNRYYLRGQLSNGKWYLEEQDELFRSSAQLIGEESDYSLLLDWHTMDQSRGAWVELFDGEIPTGYYPNSVHYFKGSYNGKPANLFWQVSENRNIQGHLQLHSNAQSYRISGRLLDLTGDFQTFVEDGYAQPKGQMNGQFHPQRSFLCRFLPEELPEQTIYFRKVDEWEKLGIYELDFLAQVELEIPQLIGEARFNQYLRDLIRPTQREILLQRSVALDEVMDFNTDQRHRLSSFSFFEIHCFEHGLISGLLTISHSWKPGYETIPFNFDLNTGQVIALEKLLDTGSFKATLSEEQRVVILENSPFSDLPQFQSWLDEVEWHLENFTSHGMQVNTPFHPVFGRQRICVSFEALAASLPADHPLKTLCP